MKVFRTAMMAIFLGGLIAPSFAQDHVPQYGEADKDKGYGEIQDEKAAAQAYKRSLGNIPDQTAPSDPWGGARGTTAAPASPAGKTAAKSPKKTKPGQGKPTEAKPTEAKPTEAKPTQTGSNAK